MFRICYLPPLWQNVIKYPVFFFEGFPFRGIHHEELESILQFIYLGETTVYHERMNELLSVAKYLDIMEIGKNVVNEEEETEYVNEKQTFDEDILIQLDENPVEDETVIGRTASQVLPSNSSSSIINDHKNSNVITKQHINVG